jgi:hypothetical protein
MSVTREQVQAHISRPLSDDEIEALIERHIDPEPEGFSIARARLRNAGASVAAVIADLEALNGDVEKTAEDFDACTVEILAAVFFFWQHLEIIPAWFIDQVRTVGAEVRDLRRSDWYGAPRHRHTGEIEVWLTDLSGTNPGAVTFTPHLVPMARGLLATCYAALRDGVSQEDVEDAIARRYADEPFVRVLPPGTFPHTKAVAGSNACHLSATVDPRAGRVVVTSAIDNLGKGAAGQAIQNANVMLGLDETLGLTAVGIYP